MNIKKLGFALNIIVLISLFFGTLIWADSNGIWTDASDLRGGTFGSDEVDTTTFYRFINPVYFDTNVGIGTTDPQAELEVNGTIRLSGSGSACSVSTEGSIMYNSTSKSMMFCNSTEWVSFNSGGDSGVGGGGDSGCSPYVEGQTWWAESGENVSQAATCNYGGSATEIYAEEVQYQCVDDEAVLTGSSRLGTLLETQGECDPGCMYNDIRRATGYTYTSYGSCVYSGCGGVYCGLTESGSRSYTSYQCQSTGVFISIGSGSQACAPRTCNYGSGCWTE